MKRKVCVFATLLSFVAFTVGAQFINPTKWHFEVKKAGKDLYDIHMSATIDAPWHIYSQFLKEGGPIPTKIVFGKNPLITVVGKAKEIGKAVKEHEEVFDMDVTYFPGKVNFVQRVKKAAGVKTNVSGSITYMVCKEGECLPVVKEVFNVKLD